MTASTTRTAPKFEIDIAADLLTATLRLLPEGVQSPPTLSEVLAYASTGGVVISEDRREAIEAFLKQPADEGRPNTLVIAEGTGPAPGRPAFLEMLPRGEPGDSPFDRLRARIARRGDVLARLVPATPAAPGRDVLGRELPAPPAEPFSPLGAHVALSENAADVVACIDGLPELVDGVLLIDDVQVVDEVAAAAEQQIEASLLVRGGLNAGTRLRVRGSFACGGTIDSAALVVGRNLVAATIAGHDRARLVAGRDIEAGSIRQAQVDAGGSVTLAGDLVGGQLLCTGRLRVACGITGTRVIAGGGIECETLGAVSLTRTFVEVGVDERVRRAAAVLLPQIEARQKQAASILRPTGVPAAPARPAAAPPRAAPPGGDPAGLLREAEQLLAELRRRLHRAQPLLRSDIVVQGTVYPGTTIRMGGVETTIRITLAGPLTIALEHRDGGAEIILRRPGEPRGTPMERRIVPDDLMASVRRLLDAEAHRKAA